MIKMEVVISSDLFAVIEKKAHIDGINISDLAADYIQVGVECERQHKEKKHERRASGRQARQTRNRPE